ncbi:hypothetical protein [Bradyrhizobium sp. UFLA05-112]
MRTVIAERHLSYSVFRKTELTIIRASVSVALLPVLFERREENDPRFAEFVGLARMPLAEGELLAHD